MKRSFKVLALVLAAVTLLAALTACSSIVPQSKQLIGSWQDSSNTSGYTFNEDGTVTITFANFSLLGQNFTGSANGAYTTLEDDQGNNHVTITYTVSLTIISNTFTEEYIYKVDKNTLTLTSVEDGHVLVLVRSDSVAANTTANTTSAASTAAAA